MTDKVKEYIFANDVDWDLKTPCSDCPFIKTSPFHGGVAGSLIEYSKAIDRHQFSHTCHKTDNRQACDGPHSYKGDRPKHCAGALMMLLKSDGMVPLQVPLLEAAERGELDLGEMTERAKADEKVFTFRGLMEFYYIELTKRMNKRKAENNGRDIED